MKLAVVLLCVAGFATLLFASGKGFTDRLYLDIGASIPIFIPSGILVLAIGLQAEVGAFVWENSALSEGLIVGTNVHAGAGFVTLLGEELLRHDLYYNFGGSVTAYYKLNVDYRRSDLVEIFTLTPNELTGKQAGSKCKQYLLIACIVRKY